MGAGDLVDTFGEGFFLFLFFFFFFFLACLFCYFLTLSLFSSLYLLIEILLDGDPIMLVPQDRMVPFYVHFSHSSLLYIVSVCKLDTPVVPK